MINLNVIGHIGKDATTNTVNGKTVINFSVAHSEKFKNSQGIEVNKTTWVDCAKWGDAVGIVPYLKKGVQVFVDGQPDVRTYLTANGQSGASLTLRVNSIQLLGSPEHNENK